MQHNQSKFHRRRPSISDWQRMDLDEFRAQLDYENREDQEFEERLHAKARTVGLLCFAAVALFAALMLLSNRPWEQRQQLGTIPVSSRTFQQPTQADLDRLERQGVPKGTQAPAGDPGYYVRQHKERWEQEQRQQEGAGNR